MIKDNLYTMFQRAIKVYKDNDGYKLIDSMYNNALKQHDIKAQCIALHLKCRYYSYKQPFDEAKLKNQLEKTIKFCEKTQYYQYIFASYETYLRVLINSKKYDKGLELLKEYQQYALKLNNPRTNARAFYQMSILYQYLLLPNMAYNNIKNGIKILIESNELTDIPQYYLQTGISLDKLADKKDSALIYFNKAYTESKTDILRTHALYHLISASIKANKGLKIIQPLWEEYHRLADLNPQALPQNII